LRALTIGSYIATVRRIRFQRWTVFLLLLGRLVFGEIAHALPHDASAMDRVAVAAQDEPPCPGHGDAATGNLAAGEHDCCKADACACPCMHLSQASLPTPELIFERVDAAPLVIGGDGLISHRVFMLFRPPA
jgi:hypothetical protein